MNDSASIVMAGLAAFAAFVPPLPMAITADARTVRVGQAYASGATLLLAYLLRSQQGLLVALFIIGLELAAFEHARRSVAA